MNRSAWQWILVAAGGLLIVGHLLALALLGMTASSWLSGTVIGLILAVVGGAHLLLPRASADPSRSRWQQSGLGLVALGIGVLEGVIAVVLLTPMWWLLIPWALTALGIGMLLPGRPPEKAARLAAFGFSSLLITVAGGQDLDGFGGVLWALLLGLAGALGAVAIGAIAHNTLGRLHRAPASADTSG